MSATLYLLRQQPSCISPSLFQASDEDIDVIFIEHAISTSSRASSMKKAVVTSEGILVSDSQQTLTYDDLVEEIFSSEHIIVI